MAKVILAAVLATSMVCHRRLMQECVCLSVRPQPMMAPRCSDPWKAGRSSHTSMPQSDIMDRVFHHNRRPQSSTIVKGMADIRSFKKIGVDRHGGVVVKNTSEKRVANVLVLLHF